MGGTSVHTGDIITGGKLETRPRRDSDGLEMARTNTETSEGTGRLGGVYVRRGGGGQVRFEEMERAPFADSVVSFTFVCHYCSLLTLLAQCGKSKVFKVDQALDHPHTV